MPRRNPEGRTRCHARSDRRDPFSAAPHGVRYRFLTCPANREHLATLAGTGPGQTSRPGPHRGIRIPDSGVLDMSCLGLRRPCAVGSRPEPMLKASLASPSSRTRTAPGREEPRRAVGHREPGRHTNIPLASETSQQPWIAVHRRAPSFVAHPSDLRGTGCPAVGDHSRTLSTAGFRTRHPLIAGIDHAPIAGAAIPD
jgi:hypothetical protein